MSLDGVTCPGKQSPVWSQVSDGFGMGSLLCLQDLTCIQKDIWVFSVIPFVVILLHGCRLEFLDSFGVQKHFGKNNTLYLIL